MKKSISAAMLSGLVFPGVGHIYLRRYVHGIILSISAGSAIYYIVSVVMTIASDVAEKIQNGDIPLDENVITDLVSQQLSGAEQPTNMAIIAFIVLWLISVVDSYRLGRADEKVKEKPGENH